MSNNVSNKSQPTAHMCLTTLQENVKRKACQIIRQNRHTALLN